MEDVGQTEHDKVKQALKATIGWLDYDLHKELDDEFEDEGAPTYDTLTERFLHFYNQED